MNVSESILADLRVHAALEPRKFIGSYGLDSETFEYERILVNQIKTPDGTLLVSTYRHHYLTYEDDNGLSYMVDGGHAYLRRNLHEDDPHEELSIYVSDDHSVNRKYFEWTSYGVDGDGPAKTQKLEDMDTDHIHAILDNGFGSTEARVLFQEELVYRIDKAVEES